ncbi:hypothetical protein V6N13_036022 [Hibiscus sabdariffa]|uniref:RNase H type-1 domain-containing protein n=1 Tax=Hibiscus sabdariffa TaxID=183260 RepID=A0ABR2S7M1_9ROSI
MRQSSTWFFSIFTTEAKATTHGLSFATDLGFHHVILENNSRSLVQKLNSSADDSSEIRPLVSNIKNLARQFVECHFHFTARDNNQVAHASAAWANILSRIHLVLRMFHQRSYPLLKLIGETFPFRNRVALCNVS